MPPLVGCAYFTFTHHSDAILKYLQPHNASNTDKKTLLHMYLIKGHVYCVYKQVSKTKRKTCMTLLLPSSIFFSKMPTAPQAV